MTTTGSNTMERQRRPSPPPHTSCRLRSTITLSFVGNLLGGLACTPDRVALPHLASYFASSRHQPPSHQQSRSRCVTGIPRRLLKDGPPRIWDRRDTRGTPPPPPNGSIRTLRGSSGDRDNGTRFVPDDGTTLSRDSRICSCYYLLDQTVLDESFQQQLRIQITHASHTPMHIGPISKSPPPLHSLFFPVGVAPHHTVGEESENRLEQSRGGGAGRTLT